MRRTGCSDRLIYDEKLLLEYIAATFPDVKEIVFEDDTFTMKKDRVLEICRLMREKGLNRRFRWLCNARVNLDLETMKAMKAAGCHLIIPGIESGKVFELGMERRRNEKTA